MRAIAIEGIPSTETNPELPMPSGDAVLIPMRYLLNNPVMKAYVVLRPVIEGRAWFKHEWQAICWEPRGETERLLVELIRKDIHRDG